MIRNLIRFSLLITTTSLFSGSLLAQSANPLHHDGERELRSSITLTIPLGGQRHAATSQPQLDLSFQQHRRQQNPHNFVSNNFDLRSNTYDFQPRETRIGFTLDRNPRLMMNGQPFDLPESTANASTVEKVGIGAAVLFGAGLLVVGTGLVIIASSDSAE